MVLVEKLHFFFFFFLPQFIFFFFIPFRSLSRSCSLSHIHTIFILLSIFHLLLPFRHPFHFIVTPPNGFLAKASNPRTKYIRAGKLKTTDRPGLNKISPKFIVTPGTSVNHQSDENPFLVSLFLHQLYKRLFTCRITNKNFNIISHFSL